MARHLFFCHSPILFDIFLAILVYLSYKNKEIIMKKRLPIIIDADPGIDDALAMLIAFANPKKLEIKLITAAVGNKSLALSVRNTLFLVDKFAPYEIPVARGEDKTYDDKEEKNDASEVHGKWGLGDFRAPTPKKKCLRGDVGDIMYEKILECKEKVVLVGMGPFTNFAHLIEKHPDVKDKIAYIFAMGASVDGKGNVTKYAEFNIHHDPVAFDMILKSGIKLVISPLHLAKETANDDHLYTGHRAKTDKEKFIYDLFDGSYEPSQPGRFCVHDAYTIHGLLRPKLYRFEPCTITVSLKPETYGQTFIKLNPKGKFVVQLSKNKDKIKKLMYKDIYKK